MSQVNQPHFHKLLDTQGLYCPEPVMLLHAAIDDVQEGEVVKLIASDPSTARDVPKFCQFLGHALELTEQANGLFYYYIKRKVSP